MSTNGRYIVEGGSFRSDARDLAEMFWFLNWVNPLFYIGLIFIVIAGLWLRVIKKTRLYYLVKDYFVVRRIIMKYNSLKCIIYYKDLHNLEWKGFDKNRIKRRKKWTLKRRLKNIKSHSTKTRT